MCAGLALLPGCGLFLDVFDSGPEVAVRQARGSAGPNGGTWKGTWTNKVTGATGTARITAMGYPRMVYASYQIQLFLTGNSADRERTTFRLKRCTGECLAG